MNQVTRRAATALASLAGACASLLAQTTPPSAPVPPPVPNSDEVVRISPFTVSEDKDQGYNSANTVGAGRFNVPIKDTPMSVMVVNSQLIQDLGATDVFDAARFVPGVSGASSRGSGQMTLRGQNIPGAVFRDGVPDNNSLDGNAFVDLALTERLEFIEGPAGTLYGSHNSGGIVNNVTKTPLSTSKQSVRVTVGDNNLKRVDLDSTGPLTADKKFSYRVILAQEDGNTNYGTVDKTLVYGLQARYAFNDGEIMARYSYTDIDRDTNAYSWFSDAGGNISTFLSRTLDLNEKDEERHYQQNNFDLDADKKFTTGPIEWTSRLKLRYAKVYLFNHLYQFAVTNFVAYDAAGNQIGDMGNILFSDPRLADIREPSRVDFIRPSWQENGTGNLDFVGDFTLGPSKQKLLLYGVYGENWFKTLGSVANYPGIDIYHPFYYANSNLALSALRPDQDQVIYGSNYAYAVQDNISFLDDRLIFVLGVRYDRATTTNLNRINNVRTYDDVRTGTSRRAGVVVRPIAPLAIYGNYSETFIPNGFDSLTGAQLPNQVPTNKEVGLKLNMFNDRLVANYAYFNTITTGALIAATVIVNGVPKATNIPAGSLVVKGWDSSLTWSPTKNFSLWGGMGNLDSKTSIGKRARSVPQGFNYKALAKYTFTESTLAGFFVAFGYEHDSERAGDAGDDITLPGYNLANLVVGYQHRRWLAQVNVDNLFDESYASLAVARPIIYAGDPRSIRGSITYSW